VVSAAHPQSLVVRHHRDGVWTDVPAESLTGAMTQVNAFESHCEFAVPLQHLGGRVVAPGLAVETSWSFPGL
jgi:hypothetical protein